MLQINFDSFLNLLNGVYVRVKADGVATAECFDLAQLWATVVGSPRFTGATADLIFNQPSTFYEPVKNEPLNFPGKGDLVCWSWPHVGVATGKNTNVHQLEVLEQNDPTGSEVHIKLYPNYSGVIGWLHPKIQP